MRGDVIQMYKIIHLIDDVGNRTLFHLVEDSGTRGHKLKITKNQSRTVMRQHTFTQRIVDLWNGLPKNIVTAPSSSSSGSKSLLL